MRACVGACVDDSMLCPPVVPLWAFPGSLGDVEGRGSTINAATCVYEGRLPGWDSKETADVHVEQQLVYVYKNNRLLAVSIQIALFHVLLYYVFPLVFLFCSFPTSLYNFQ